MMLNAVFFFTLIAAFMLISFSIVVLLKLIFIAVNFATGFTSQDGHWQSYNVDD
jgi:hypothetical protein